MLRDPNALIIFLKNPILGKVKTRIATSVGDQQALDIYTKLIKHTRLICEKVNTERYLFYSDFVDNMDHFSSILFNKKQQTGTNLGERMLDAFIDVLCFHKKAIIIGSDCLEIDDQQISQAFEALDQDDIVIGPATDGGYYLLGMKTLHKDLFINMPWSTDRLYDITKQKIQSLGLKYKELDMLSDIDHYEDWTKK